jgi:hypothetical protein
MDDPLPSPAAGMGTVETFLAKMGAGMTDLNLGAAQRIAEAAEMVGPTQSARDYFGQEKERLRKKAEEKRALDKPLLDSRKGFGGYVVGTALPGLMAPGANPYLVGAANNAIMPTVSDSETATNIAVGAAAPKVAQWISNAVTRAISPLVSRMAPSAALDASQDAIRRAEMVNALRGKGVSLTPGQIAGGAAGRIESGLESIPISGDAIRAAKSRAVQSMNRAVIDEAMAPLNLKLPENLRGRDAIAWMNEHASKAYEDFLPTTHAKSDQQFIADMMRLRGMVQGSNMPGDLKKEFEDVLQRDLFGRMSPQGTLHAEYIKAADSAIRQAKERFTKSPDSWQRDLGNAFGEVRKSLKDMIGRNDPEAKAAMDAADAAYAKVMRIRDASMSAAAVDGVFSPAALAREVRNSANKSGRRRALSEGRALMQDTAEAAKEIMGEKVPDSGTPFRSLTTLAGLLGASPHIGLGPAAGMAGTMAAYSEPGQRLINAVLFSRPEIMEQIAGNVTKGAGAISPMTAPALAQMLRGQ